MIKVAFFDTKPYDKEAFDAAVKRNVTFSFFDVKLDESTVGLASGHDAVCVFVNDVVNAAVIDRLHGMGISLVALRCAGFNNVDVKAAYGKIKIVRVPAYSPNAVAEHTMALLLTSVRRIHKAYNRTREYNFSLSDFVGFNLQGKTVGVVGAGKIGRAFIKICRGFGMNVLVCDPVFDETLDARYVDLDELIRESDVISLHCPLTEGNHHLIDRERIGKMKRGVVLLNTSRGALVDAEALLDGIVERKIGAACLDVYEEESDLFFDDRSNHILDDGTLARLLSMPNVLVTAHQAFLTKEALAAIAEATVENIEKFFDGDEMKNEVLFEDFAKETFDL